MNFIIIYSESILYLIDVFMICIWFTNVNNYHVPLSYEHIWDIYTYLYYRI